MTVLYKCQRPLVVVGIIDGDKVDELLPAVTLSVSPGLSQAHIVVLFVVCRDGGKS